MTITGCLVLPVGGSLDLRAGPADGTDGSNVKNRWTTTSANLRLDNADQETVTVVSLENPSASKGAEVVTVERTSDGCPSVTATANMTVIRVKFFKSAAQSYGYDNMDTPADTTDDHVSVKKLATTQVHTTIEGGLNGNEIEFICDDTSVAQPGAAPVNADFDLPVTGQDKGETVLRARVLCPGHAECTHININTVSGEGGSGDGHEGLR